MSKHNVIIIAVFLLFIGCDKVKNPRVNNNSLTGSNFIEKDNTQVLNIKKVLLEDYTGHTCGNCPKAATKAEELSNLYKDTIIVIAPHVGFYAEPTSSYPSDYRTPAGTDWDNFFGVSASGLPRGMINRINYPTATHLFAYTAWAANIPPLIRIPPSLTIKLKTQYDTTSRILNILHTVKFNQNFNSDLYLNSVLIEDSIVGKQKDYSVTPNDIENYVFHNMLRGSLNGSWGNLLKSSPIVANDSVVKNITGHYVSSSFNDKKLYVVSFVYDNSTKEVIQCEKVKIR